MADQDEDMRADPAKIVRADKSDADTIMRLHPLFFSLFVRMVLQDGEIYTTEGRTGTALWLPVAARHADEQALGKCYEPILGAEYAKRIAALDERSAAHHPGHAEHVYLPFIAVRPDFTGHGIGKPQKGRDGRRHCGGWQRRLDRGPASRGRRRPGDRRRRNAGQM
jgi:GNAT superfamily N-acetyltransferase